MNTYRTSDLYLSAFLKARGMRLKDKVKDGNKFAFVFDERVDRKELIQEFFNDGNVNITAFKKRYSGFKDNGF